MSDDQTYYASEYTIYYFHKNNIYIRGERFTNSPNRGNKFGDRRKMGEKLDDIFLGDRKLRESKKRHSFAEYGGLEFATKFRELKDHREISKPDERFCSRISWHFSNEASRSQEIVFQRISSSHRARQRRRSALTIVDSRLIVNVMNFCASFRQ